MKLQIDTEAKTIKLEQSEKITEIISIIKKLLPNDEWKLYSLEAVAIINNCGNMIYIDRWKPYPYWYNPYSTLSGGTSNINAANGNNCMNFEITN